MKKYFKRILTLILAFTMLSSCLSYNGFTVSAVSTTSIIKSVSKKITGFKTIKGHKYYFVKGKVTKGLKTIKKELYYFSKSGKMQIGLKSYNGKKYYFKSNGKALKNSFKTINNKKYYFTSSGAAKVGLLNLNNSKYKNKRYYFNSSGVSEYGFITYKGVKYYIKSNGNKFVGFVTVDKSKYYVTSSGKIQIGFLSVSGKKYYFNSAGKMQTGYQLIDSKMYYFQSNGVMQTGFITIDGFKYYFNKNGVMEKGLTWIDDKLYSIQNDGKIFTPTNQSGWVVYNNGDKYFYTENGELLKSMVVKLYGNYYGFDSEGRMYRGKVQIGNYTYYFNLDTGAALIGWNDINSSKYYFDSNGYMVFGFNIISKHLYYFNDEGVLQNTGSGKFSYSGKTYTQDITDGFIKSFWFDYAGESYYFDDKGVMVTGVKTIDGIKCYFDEQGRLYNDKGKSKGIDVSKWNGNIDWKKVKASGVQFAMIRIGYEYTLDPRFKEYINGAKAAGLDVGVYIYSYAETVNEAKKEADFCIKNLAPYKLEYPVAFDIEDSVQSVLSNKLRTDIVDAFCKKMQDAGYYTTIYASKSWLETKFDTTRLAKYDKWVAQWPYGDTVKNYTNVSDDKCTYKSKYGIWQFTSSGKIDGVSSSRVDLNFSYTNYPRLIKKLGYNNW